MKRMACLALGLLLLTDGAGLRADEGGEAPGDPRVRELLETGGMVFGVDPDGDFRLIMEYESGRTQVVFVRSTTDWLRELEIREIYSPAMVGDTLLGCDTLSLLMHHNQENPLGAWLIDESAAGPAAIFCVRIPVDPAPEVFLHLIGVVGQTADEVEESLTGRDEY